jgi:hypothetical protein
MACVGMAADVVVGAIAGSTASADPGATARVLAGVTANKGASGRAALQFLFKQFDARFHGGQLFGDIRRTCRVWCRCGSARRYIGRWRMQIRDLCPAIRMLLGLRVTPITLTHREAQNNYRRKG